MEGIKAKDIAKFMAEKVAEFVTEDVAKIMSVAKEMVGIVLEIITEIKVDEIAKRVAEWTLVS